MALFGQKTLIPAMSNVDPIIVSLPVSTLVYICVSLFTAPVTAKVTDIAFKGIKNA